MNNQSIINELQTIRAHAQLVVEKSASMEAKLGRVYGSTSRKGRLDKKHETILIAKRHKKILMRKNALASK